MGMGTPNYVLPGTVGPLEQQRQQEYMNQFNNSATAPIPGYTGPANQNQGLLGAPQQTTADSMQSQWNSLNGRLLGDTYLPPDVSTVDVGKGWYEVNHGGQRVGTLRPGGPNGRFLNDTNWQMPQPGLVGGPPVAPPGSQPGGSPAPLSPPFSASGRYGAQAMQMAGLLGQQTPAGQPQPGDGLLGGPKRGFRIPGGK
jgi:hypothetical protein